MRRLVSARLLTGLLTVWAAVTLAFFALRVLPGDAVLSEMLRGGAPEDQIAERRAALGLDAPLPLQYGRYFAGLLHGNMGVSLISRLPVTRLIADQLGPTIALATAALFIALASGIGLGSLEAVAWPHWPARFAGLLSILFLASPVYWTGTLAIFVFSSWLGWLPATGSGDLAHLILPAAVLGLNVGGSIARITRTSLRQVLDADFIRTAHAKGLPVSRVLGDHLLRAGLPPIIAVVALQTGFLLGGTVITEAIFARQGLGQLLFRAILDQDFPVVQGIVVLSAVTYSLLGILADLLYGLLDPRLRAPERS
jgi:peptide/nickel transport system permease protein